METILFAPIERVSEPPTNPPRRKLDFSWKQIAIAFIALFAIVAFITYQIKKATQEEEKKLEDIVHPHHPWVTLQTKAANQILEDCSNNVVGLQRIVESYVDNSGTPSNWWGLATVEFINKVGGIERKTRWYVFESIPNEDNGKIVDVVAHEDLDRWEADEIGNADDQYKMGIRYLEGHQAWKDADKARDYFQKAAAQGNKDATAELAKLPPNL